MNTLNERWIVRGGRAQPIVDQYGIAPFIARILAGRLDGQNVNDFLDREGSIFDPSLLLDMDKACAILRTSILEKKKICIVGDYDVDGMTSTAILYLGIKHIDPSCDLMYRIPERITDGYGFSKGIALELVEEGVQTAITCDNGVREFETASYLKEQDVRLVITDHHEIALDEQGDEILPSADAVVNPHRQGDGSPDHTLCGAFVAFQTIRALMRAFGLDSENDLLMHRLMGYAALGTICDVMPLKGSNRKIVYQGLNYLNADMPVGLSAMTSAASIKQINTYAAGYTIGPMINAGGRLGSQNRFLDVLISDSAPLCKNLAAELHLLNKNRQQMTEKGIEDGIKQAETLKEDRVKVIYLPDLHESIAGLVAGKLRESLNRPLFVITKGLDGLKGSGRSIETYHMFASMNEVSELFEKFGGHAMAAGFTLKTESGKEEEAVQRMRIALNERCTLTEEDLIPVVYIDSTMDPSRISLNLVKELEMLSPFGTGNTKPLLAVKNAQLMNIKPLGKTGKYFSMDFRFAAGVVRTVCFNGDLVRMNLIQAVGETEAAELMRGGRVFRDLYFDLVYYAEIDEYYGSERVSIKIQHIRPSAK